eukprot:gnl/TRDRNA2_/TRDRNA2_43325_c0_seq1.p1 gnl/TRDRNA2_/TRDRNA2_43325_c0~~gnl/TRDRNA2_/TRDRNA2_43325_c0_seq1.p1  ORF type:complete len:537 (-),score=68.61 gnl/TRDRNA2_/TRDRNA2_43325_c0_seq1:393-2003(-)
MGIICSSHRNNSSGNDMLSAYKTYMRFCAAGSCGRVAHTAGCAGRVYQELAFFLSEGDMLNIQRNHLERKDLVADPDTLDNADKHRLRSGWCAWIFKLKYRNDEVVAKMPIFGLRLEDDKTDRKNRPLECLWCREPVDDGWFILRSFLTGDVLTRYGKKVTLGPLMGSGKDWNQHWILDRCALVSRMLDPFERTPGWGGALDVFNGKDVMLYQRHGHDARNQQWEFEPGFYPLPLRDRDRCPFAIVSKMEGRRLLVPFERHGGKVKTLNSMKHEAAVLCDVAGPGLVKLNCIVWDKDCCMPSCIVMASLRCQLGPGSSPDGGDWDSVLSRLERSRCRMPAATVAQGLLPVAQFLERLHAKGLTHNDLHDGNILSTTDAEPWNFVAIDMGNVNEAAKLAHEHKEDAIDANWLRARDVRALALQVVSLLVGRRLDFYEYIHPSDERAMEAKAAPYKKLSLEVFEAAERHALEAPPLDLFLRKAFADSEAEQLWAREAVELLMLAANSRNRTNASRAGVVAAAVTVAVAVAVVRRPSGL